jgi:hypothetical protein
VAGTTCPKPIPQQAAGFDPIADLIGTVEGGPDDMSARKKEYLKAKNYLKPSGSRPAR